MNFLSEITKSILICFIIVIAITSLKKISNIYKIEDTNNKRNIKDVLFIYGCDKNLDSYQYRIKNQMEQLKACFLESDECFYLNLDPIIVLSYRVLVLFFCPLTKKVEEAIRLAKNLNKRILFDIDDVSFDKIYKDIHSDIKILSQKQNHIDNNLINNMGKALKFCDGIITNTEALAKELKNYSSNVFINRNMANDEIWKISQKSLKNVNNIKNKKHIIIGYFSDNTTPDPNINMIKPALIKILYEFTNIQIFLIGEFDLTNFLNDYSSQIIKKTFKDQEELSEIISNIDINISPIELKYFNKIKSENKWVKASLFKVPTIASNFGEFKHIIHQNQTGLLCSDLKDWYLSLKMLIENESLRKTLGENAYNACKLKYNTIYNGRKLSNYINSIANKHIGFYMPSLHNTGGFYVIMKHACILKEKGWNVDLILNKERINLFEFQNHIFNIISLEDVIMTVQYDIIVATFYTTLIPILNYYKTKKRLYLVQNYETDFYPYGDYYRSLAEKTYSTSFGVKYITISKWCQDWLWEKYGKKSRYAPNGFDSDEFKSHRRNLNKKKIRILIEGDSSSYYKNIDESFQIIQKLDKNKFEVWYLSYKGKPKDWYRFNKFFNEVPHEKVSKIYENCDILLKSSWLESFSYPPLEMMATGGYSIVVPNEGNKEYLNDGENCLFYKLGNINSGVDCINRLISDEKLQQHLYENGLMTAKKRDWKIYKNQVIRLYDY